LLTKDFLVNLQPVHLVGVSGNVIWVTSKGPCGEDVHQFEMFEIFTICGQTGHQAQNC